MKLSQEKFAELCGLDATHVGRVERGEKNVTMETIYKISRTLKLKPSWLFDKANQ
jgi:transcriptional regulator with XRE-family HTH domain